MCFMNQPLKNHRSVARFRGLLIVPASDLGSRCASPQALCYRLLRRLVALFQRTLATGHYVQSRADQTFNVSETVSR